MEEIRIYRQSSLYTASAWLLVFGRIGVVAMLPVFALLFLVPARWPLRPPAWLVGCTDCLRRCWNACRDLGECDPGRPDEMRGVWSQAYRRLGSQGPASRAA